MVEKWEQLKELKTRTQIIYESTIVLSILI